MLVAANVVVLAMAFYLQMSLRSLMLVYWMQSVVIGVANVIRILKLERWSSEGMKPAAHPLAHSALAKVSTAVFFAVHYGIFHLVYLFFIALPDNADLGPAAVYLLGALVFALNHAFSLRENLKSDAAGAPNLKRMLFMPYARIIPMHVMIVSGLAFTSSTGWPILVFGLLKTVADALMQRVERRLTTTTGELVP